MNAQQLSERLARVASFVPEGARVADIGSDHAYLPCYLVANGKARAAVAGEVVKGPYESAWHQVREEGLEDRITVRLADGLRAIEPEDQIDTVTIAGMGGSLIRSILENGKEALTGVKTLVLQSNIHARTLREWAEQHNWRIADEAILEENRKIYEVLVLQPSQTPVSFTAEEKLLGPVLMKERSDVFRRKWTGEIMQWRRVLHSMKEAEATPELQARRMQLEENISMAEGVMRGEDTERI
ncbi:tRNA (adenine(22)-N(1))-methyltransferase [Planococcus lenghuensis]|uniref:SAM-dependent methyltransferase n=1 Tax=Planococcus lenghuensis TaxID=2213202 RepID=A0A1Q2KXQ6_9BACL|nr:tRNA (adenine(22)-N(1))-methyltransferase TrmK [Planococcus lenghuensis]AQQ52980.1 SAM-dependent methyltransferase [Planococcus lenghuensis]